MEPGSEKESRVWDVLVVSKFSFAGARSWGLSRGLGQVGAVESWEQGLSGAMGSSAATLGGERHWLW